MAKVGATNRKAAQKGSNFKTNLYKWLIFNKNFDRL
jgi:hypothetical protein